MTLQVTANLNKSFLVKVDFITIPKLINLIRCNYCKLKQQAPDLKRDLRPFLLILPHKATQKWT